MPQKPSVTAADVDAFMQRQSAPAKRASVADVDAFMAKSAPKPPPVTAEPSVQFGWKGLSPMEFLGDVGRFAEQHLLPSWRTALQAGGGAIGAAAGVPLGP